MEDHRYAQSFSISIERLEANIGVGIAIALAIGLYRWIGVWNCIALSDWRLELHRIVESGVWTCIAIRVGIGIGFSFDAFSFDALTLLPLYS